MLLLSRMYLYKSDWMCSDYATRVIDHGGRLWNLKHHREGTFVTRRIRRFCILTGIDVIVRRWWGTVPVFIIVDRTVTYGGFMIC
ncbi:MAG: hypothetical protein ACLTZT_07370 [Butyricimonas faecalis]